jgi:hypothetical protein
MVTMIRRQRAGVVESRPDNEAGKNGAMTKEAGRATRVVAGGLGLAVAMVVAILLSLSCLFALLVRWLDN